MKVGLLGGSFDPIHKGHVSIVKEAIKHFDLDCFYFIPTKNNPWKDHTVASGEERYEMIEIATSDEEKIKIDRIELDASDDGKNYTIDTLRALVKMHPDVSYYYLMGMDQAASFDKWVEAGNISKLVQLVAFNRADYPSDHENLDRYHFIKMNNVEMKASSSEIKEGHLEMLDERVLAYISRKGLYLETMIKPYLSLKRYNHSLSVAKLTREFAKCNGIDPQKGYIAGLMHDIAKEMDHKKASLIMSQEFAQFMDKPVPVWHQWLSAYLCKKDFLLDDKEILKAIEDHTTASTSMSVLGKCLYCADKLDPLRGYDSSKEIEICKENIHVGFSRQLKQFYDFSKAKNREIDPLFFEVYKTYGEGDIYD